MRIQLLSDLHLERQPWFEPVVAPGADVLVLAGDIGSYQAGSLLKDDDFGLGRFSPLKRSDAWREVFYLPGNHEYDGLDFDATRARLQETCARLGITWLEGEVLVRDGVRFVGSTLWADFDALGADRAALRNEAGQTPLTAQLKLREKAFRAADFYLRKFHTLRDGTPQLAEQVREWSLQSQTWLREALATPFDGLTIAVTHFAPSLRSADPRYGVNPGTAGFCNALDDLLPGADVWMHGHLHCAIDYEAGGIDAAGNDWRCRVVANPLGYADKGEQAGFVPDWSLDTDAPCAALQPAS